MGFPVSYHSHFFHSCFLVSFLLLLLLSPLLLFQLCFSALRCVWMQLVSVPTTQAARQPVEITSNSFSPKIVVCMCVWWIFGFVKPNDIRFHHFNFISFCFQKIGNPTRHLSPVQHLNIPTRIYSPPTPTEMASFRSTSVICALLLQFISGKQLFAGLLSDLRSFIISQNVFTACPG